MASYSLSSSSISSTSPSSSSSSSSSYRCSIIRHFHPVSGSMPRVDLSTTRIFLRRRFKIERDLPICMIIEYSLYDVLYHTTTQNHAQGQKQMATTLVCTVQYTVLYDLVCMRLSFLVDRVAMNENHTACSTVHKKYGSFSAFFHYSTAVQNILFLREG